MEIEKIKGIIAKHAKVDVNDLKDELRFKEDLHLDSIDLFQIVMEIEETFSIKIDDNLLLNITTVKDAIDRANDARS